MKPFTEFCAHYELDPATAEAREEYRDYCDKLTLFRDMLPKDEPALEFRRIRILSAEDVTAAYLAKGASHE